MSWKFTAELFSCVSNQQKEEYSNRQGDCKNCENSKAT